MMNMRMSQEDIRLLRYSLQRFQEENAAMAELFYANLFDFAPHLRPMFGPDIAGQTRKTMLEVAAIVALLSEPDKCRAMVEDLAIRHIAYGTRPEHYPLVGKALLTTIRQVFGSEFPPEIYAAWERAFARISETMIAATEGRKSA
jgi:nitric oxide dioxygenase